MIVVVGLSHHLSDINMRERVALQGDALKQAYEDAASSGVINEVIWWSTCARTECIAVGHPDQIKQWFIHYFKLSSTSEDQIYQYTADVACCYWLRVACGLDSKIMGEPQILGQLKRAFEQARAQGTLGSVLSFWAPTILKEAKRIRAVTGLTATTASLPAMTKRIAHRIFESTESLRWLVVGTGALAAEQLALLSTLPVGSVHVVGRNREKTSTLAAQFGAQWSTMSHLPQLLSETDVWVTTTASTLPFITQSLTHRAQKARNHRALLIADLAMPRDVESDVSAIDQVYLYPLEVLTDLIASEQAIHQNVLSDVEQAVTLSIEAHLTLEKEHSVSLILKKFRDTIDFWRDDVERWGLKQLTKGVDPEIVLHQSLRRFSRQVSHGPTWFLKQAARRQQTHLIEGMQLFLNMMRPLKRHQKESQHADHTCNTD
ncbi:MAG: glutamyl-tRNA reductase [Legionellales bacterium]|nr:glutamyl-tRNA reductase [Legionellales bacterium]